MAGGAQGLGLESSGSLLGKGVRTLDSSQCNPPPPNLRCFRIIIPLGETEARSVKTRT